MTDLMLKNIKSATVGEDIPFDKQTIVAWINEKVDALEKIHKIISETDYGCFMGDFDTGISQYPVSIETCAWRDRGEKEIHIYSGLQKLADAVDAEVFKVQFMEGANVKYYFVYRDIEFFELCDIGEELR